VIIGEGIFTGRHPSCHPTNNIKPPKQTTPTTENHQLASSVLYLQNDAWWNAAFPFIMSVF